MMLFWSESVDAKSLGSKSQTEPVAAMVVVSCLGALKECVSDAAKGAHRE